MPAVLSSPCPRPCPASGVQCPVRPSGLPPVRVHVTGVRCGRLSVQMSGVWSPAWVSGVRGFPRPLCPAGRLWRVAVGRRPHGWDGRRRRGRLPCPRPVRRLPGRNLAVEAGAGLLGQRRGRFGVSRRRRRWLGQVARSTAWATRIGWMGAGIARWWRAGVRSEAATTLRGHRVRPRAESPGRCEPPGLDCDLRVRPWCGRSM